MHCIKRDYSYRALFRYEYTLLSVIFNWIGRNWMNSRQKWMLKLHTSGLSVLNGISYVYHV